MRVAVLFIAVFGNLAGLSAVEDEKKDGLGQLAGTWVAESREYEGRKESKADLKGLKLTVSGKTFTFRNGEGQVVMEGTLTVDSTTTPKSVDVRMVKDGKEQVLPGIFEVDGDTLRSTIPQTPAARPKDFTAKPGSGVRVSVYKRVKE